MAATPQTITSHDMAVEGPTGKNAGATTKAARKGAAEGGAIATLIAYVLVKSGLEANAETAVLIAGALATVLATVVSHFKGKGQPTDQARTERHTKTRTVVAPGPVSVPRAEIDEDGIPRLEEGADVAVTPDVEPEADEDDEPRHRAEVQA